MNPAVQKLVTKRDAIKASMRSLVDAAEKEDRDFRDEEQTNFDAYNAEVSELDTRINRLETVLAEARAEARPAESCQQPREASRLNCA